MARFWSMTGIEPSFTHSIASIYILCFTLLTIISIKILRFNPTDRSLFFYDANQKYFEGLHIAAALFSILVLLVFILLPTLYILLYPFKWFHKLLDWLHLRKQLLISLGDVFTGPYKNGTDGTYDYRFFAGLYLLVRIITLALLLIVLPAPYSCHYFGPSAAIVASSILAIMIMIFRPFQRNIHSFFEVLFLYFIMIFTYILVLIYKSFWLSLLSVFFSGLIFGIILPIYIMSMLCKKIFRHYKRRKDTLRVDTDNQEEDDDDPLVVDENWIADRMENPQEYDERHVSVRLDDLTKATDKPIDEPNQPITISTTVTYGSV
uniref:TRP C-terminal domain-containing protein n=1 Tax=Amphimedon queenslandica TaxID=400682 RepID=A0A1X7UR30_AMPQE